MAPDPAATACAARYGFLVSDARPHGWGLRVVVQAAEREESTFGLIYLGCDGRTYLYARDGAGYLSIPLTEV